MDRNTRLLAGLAGLGVARATPFELLSVPLAPMAALRTGAVAGWSVAARGASAARAGLIVGRGALVGSVPGLAVLALWIGNIPEVQTFVQVSALHPRRASRRTGSRRSARCPASLGASCSAWST